MRGGGSLWLRAETLSYFILVSGVLGDHISTGMVLSTPGLYEANSRVALLISMGLWAPLDTLFVILGLLIPYISIRASRSPFLRGLLAYPLVHGGIRLGATLWNLILLTL